MSAMNSPMNVNTPSSSQSKRNKKRNKNKNKQSVTSPTNTVPENKFEDQIIDKQSIDNQSISQSINQPIYNQSVEESIIENESIESANFNKNVVEVEPVKVSEYGNELKSQPINQSISGQSITDHSVNETVRLDSQSISQPIFQPISQPISHPVSQPLSQPMVDHSSNQSINQSFSEPLNAKTDRMSSGSVSDEPVSMVANMTSTQNYQSDWLAIQGKTFLRWVNYYLSQRDLSAQSINQSFTDGNLLCHLIEILSGSKLPKWRAVCKSQVQRLDNLSIAFRFLEDHEKIKLINLRIGDIEQGNEKMTMALIWSLIVHWQIDKIAKLVKKRKQEAAEAAKKAQEMNNQSIDQSIDVDTVPLLADTPVVSAKSELLAWVNSKVLLYDVKPVRDFTSSFQDGSALSALTDALLTEQARLLSIMKSNAIEHQAEHMSADGKKVLDLPSDPLQSVNAAIIRAENELRIPPLIDAVDLVNQPNEQAVMTYIACFRDREQTLATIGHEAHVELPVVEAEPAEVLAVVTDEQAPLNDNELIDAQSINQPFEAVVIKPEEEMLSLSNDASINESVPVIERIDEIPEQAPIEHVTTPVALRTAEMNVESATSTYNPPGTPTHVVSAALINDQSIDQTNDQSIDQTGDASIDQSIDDEKHLQHEPAGFVAAQQFHEEEMKQTEPPNQSINPSINQSINTSSVDKPAGVSEVDVCMTNVDLQYVQARPEGQVIVDAANSQWSVWTVIDEQGSDTVYFRDHLGRYLTSSPDGLTVKMGPKSELSRWHVTRGKQQKFQNLAQLYLTARDGVVTCEPAQSMHANLTLNFPVIEGYLKKKGSSGLKRWQSRYFAFNGAVMSYWSRKEEAGVNRIPKGVYYPKHIAAIECEKHDPSKFMVKFADDKVVVLDAGTPVEAKRWMHSLEMTGVKIIS